jgi:two-component system, sensor histidine kinase and response regulator
MKLLDFDPHKVDGARLFSNQRLLFKYYDAVSLMAASILLVGVPFVFARKWPAAVLGLLLLACSMGARHLAARGRFKLSIRLFGAAIWLLVACLVFFGLPGIFTGMLAAAALVMAVVDSRRLAIWYGASYLAAWLVFVLAQTAGWQPPKFFPGSPFAQWFLSAFVFWITLLPVVALIQDLQHMLKLTKLESEKRAEAERQYRLAAEKAEAAAVAKGYFLANMSHEIRTPMNAIHGMLNLLGKTALSPQQKGYVGQAELASQSLLALVNGILDFSKIDAGKVLLEKVPFDTELFFQSIAVVGGTAVGSKPVEILIDVDPLIPPVLVGDPTRFQQVLVNLLSNAVKFTGSGEVRLCVRVVSTSPDQVGLEVVVTDTGVGIAADHLPMLFEAFNQAEASTTRRFGGTGLGLSICKRLLQAMGTDIQVESELGRGSRFSFRIHLNLEPGHAPAKLQPNSPGGQGAVDVLVGHTGLLELLQKALPCQPLPVQDPETAWVALAAQLEAYPANAPAGKVVDRVVLLDADLPNGMAMHLLRRLEDLAPERLRGALRVVVLCKCGVEDNLGWPPVSTHLRYGFLNKPFTRRALYEAVWAPGPWRPRPVAARPRRLPGMRVLLVEDNPVNRQVAEELLVTEGASVLTAENGQLAVDTLRRSPDGFDVVLMDLQMPVLDGLEATAMIRKELGIAQLPILAMTANAFDSDRQACLDAGMNDHIGKPFDLNVLVAKLLKHTSCAVDATAPHLGETGPSPADDDFAHHAVWARESALRRIGGQSGLLDKLISRFQVDLVTQLSNMDGAAAEKDLAALKAILHSIKGASATVGAERLSREAAQAEGTARRGEWPSLAQLKATAQRTLDALDPAAVGPDPTLSGPVAGALGLTSFQVEGLTRLLKLAESNDMEVLEVMDTLLGMASEDTRSGWLPLQQAVDSLDFQQVRVLVDGLLKAQALTSSPA